MRWYIGIVTLLLSMVVSMNAVKATQTSDLLTDNFMTDWSGTNDHYHGSNILAGVHNEYKEQTITLSDHLTVPEIQGGFTSTFEAEVWHWNSFEQTTTLTQTIESATGDTVNQTVTMNHTCNNWNGCTYIDSPENIIITPSNNELDYEITARFDFDVPSRTSGHYGADIRNPSLIIDYNEFTIDLSDFENVTENFFDIEQDLTLDFGDWVDDFEEMYIDDSFDDFIFIEDMDLAYEPVPFMEIEGDFFFFDDFGEEADYDLNEVDMPLLEEEELPFFLGDNEEFFETEETMFAEISEPEEESEVIEEEITEFVELSEDEPETMVVKEEMTFTEAAGEPKEGAEVVEVTTDTNIAVEVREVVYKGIDKYLNETVKKLDKILQNQPIIEDTVFYETKDIYTDQVVFVDNRNIYQEVVVIDDPMTQYNNQMNDILRRKNNLQLQIQRIKWRD